MISVAQAMQLIQQAMPGAETETVAIADACSRILAQDVCSPRDQPPFDRVMMDGIAIDFQAWTDGRTSFARQGTQAAGAPALTLDDPTRCIEIMTGAVLPANTDCVIPIEQVCLDGQHARLEAGVELKKWQFIHRAGSDYRQNDTLLRNGTLIGGPEMAVLASAGSASIKVARLPAIRICAVGDELVDPGEKMGPAQIPRSNDFAIDALLRTAGLGNNNRDKLPDDPAVLHREIGKALCERDVVVLTGGVSMGKYDYIPAIMKELGVDIILHKVAQTPGKPMWVGRKANRMVFALPGNPVSSLVCARRYVIPAIHGAMGWHQETEVVALSQSVQLNNKLARLVPVKLHRQASGMMAEPRLPNTSGDFHALSGTTGFVELPAGPGTVATGFSAPLWRW